MLNISGFSFLPPAKYIKYCSLKGSYKGPIFKIQNGSLLTRKILINSKNNLNFCSGNALNFVYL
jgi:hypothetical protein